MELQLLNRRVCDTLKLKVDTGAEGSILSLRTYRRMFPRNLNASGFPKSTEVTHRPVVTITAYKQHGAISLRWLPIDKAFSTIKSLICNTTTLAHFDSNKESVLLVDNSQEGLESVLMQDSQPIAFASKSLTDIESRYANIERERLAVVYACERFHTYLYGKPFVVQCDHKPLEMIQLKNIHAAPPRLQRMLLRLQNYGVTIKYQPRRTLLLADGLSRLLENRQDSPIQLDMRVNLVQFSQGRVKQLREETARDPALSPLTDVLVKLPKVLKPYWSDREEWSIDDGVFCLYMNFEFLLY